LAFLLCGDWDRADDLVQETLVRLHRRWASIAIAGADAYARRVLLNVTIDERRRPWRREIATEVLPEVVGIDPEPAGVHLLSAALRALPPRQRAVLVLRFFDDLSVEQTAAALDCSTGTVKSQTARGLARLRRLLPDDELAYHEGLR
jgi:RNA polymerase sigma-70 factor (sigma-E family)